MSVRNLKNIAKVTGLLILAGNLMGNKGCDKGTAADEGRHLRRRVQLGKIVAPEIQLPAGVGSGSFDFGFVANAQMADILNKTQSFSTATIDPDLIYDTTGLGAVDASDFNQCVSDEGPVSTNTNGISDLHQKITFSRNAACMIEMPQAVVSGEIFDFMLTNGNNVNLSLFQVPFLKGVSFGIKKYELSVQMEARSPFEKDKTAVLSVVQKQAIGKAWNAEVGLNFGALALGFGHYSATPLRKLVDEAFTGAVRQLRDNWHEPWYGMVLRNCDSMIYINGGNAADANLVKGDIVKIVNVIYGWNGPVCQSSLTMDIAEEVVAYAKVVSVGRNMSIAKIIERDPNYPHLPNKVYPGARVYMEKMYTPPAPAAPAKKAKSAPVKQSFGRS